METNGISIEVSTDAIPLIPEVLNLKATTKHDRINLSWSNPQSEFFNHIRIYRRLDETHTATIKENLINELLKSKTAFASDTVTDFDPMFETNGTYWNDLTVQAATTYSYKLTTVNIADAESDGIIVQATTLEEPKTSIEGGGYEKKENGDFLYTWTSPTTGKVKVLIDGKEYKTVQASLKQILIPAADMKYDIFNNPRVSLVAISEDGKEGTPTAPKPGQSGGTGGETGTVKIPFDVNELVQTGFGLLKIVGPFVLLGLSFLLVKPIRNVIRKALLNYRERSIHR
ncbi:hypothetical protein [Bacillus sp. Bva_UNVM-123]|uniref:hypothetical protein n=1 Tax=Bacillus sp. Bva_UNVM-123 TaxID=2829798 RepID=UPI00391F0B19